jgi:RNase H-fold protein (predicted Holliday junction resolvase)
MYIGIDVGGTKTLVAGVLDISNIEILDVKKILNQDNFELDVKNLIENVKEISKKESVEAIGLGLPGTLDVNGNGIDFTNLASWNGRNIRKKLEDEFTCPVFIDNDAVVASFGISYFSEIKKDFIYITWGTGIGGALVRFVNGKVVSKELDWEKYFKSWEEKCGGKRIQERYNKIASELTEGEWKEIMEDFKMELLIFMSKFDTGLVVFGGGISVKQEIRLKDIRIMNKQIEISQLGENVGLYGAFALIRNNI